MNYRHRFHAGNFGDVMKHVLLLRLIAALQRKEKGFLFLDTHAGRGRYDLEAAGAGHSLVREPEWPEGIGRLWRLSGSEVPDGVREYVALVRDFDRRHGNLSDQPRIYPGSPWLARLCARPVDRIVLCEKHRAECSALRAEMRAAPRVSVHEMDGYASVRAMLPPPERRALVHLDPPFEAQDEFAVIARALHEGVQRQSNAVFAVWYPLTGRARVEEFFAAVQSLNPPETIAAELTIAGETSAIKMRGCGLLVVNPPWRFEVEASALVEYLARVLAREPGGGSRVEWIVRDDRASPRAGPTRD